MLLKTSITKQFSALIALNKVIHQVRAATRTNNHPQPPSRAHTAHSHERPFVQAPTLSPAAIPRKRTHTKAPQAQQTVRHSAAGAPLTDDTYSTQRKPAQAGLRATQISLCSPPNPLLEHPNPFSLEACRAPVQSQPIAPIRAYRPVLVLMLAVKIEKAPHYLNPPFRQKPELLFFLCNQKHRKRICEPGVVPPANSPIPAQVFPALAPQARQ